MLTITVSIKQSVVVVAINNIIEYKKLRMLMTVHGECPRHQHHPAWQVTEH